jgi:hypothetical protein
VANRPYQVIGVLWISLGATLATDVVIDFLGAVNTISSITSGLAVAFALEVGGSVLAILNGVALVFGVHWVRYIALLTSILFAVYLVLYLILGGEGSLLVRVIVPSLLLALCVTTLRAVRQKRTTG